MEKPIITMENISKKYQISHRGKDNTLRDAIVSLFTRNKGVETFWALKNINLDVYKGEIIGLIGRNGAGKSTLLKILSRITPPTTGEIRIRGRVASLLEVGTGFHSELTGRENIYLNGSILGMKKAEINRKFDDIVKFSGIEQFLDTPVKRYSSGMFVRLAFSVAAHLEPEILLVDEVLAVGDARFQKKSLGKMKEVTQSGRTIIFVSHNMGAIASLCHKVVLIEKGEISKIGDPESTIRYYLESFKNESQIHLANRTDRNFSGEVIFTDIRFLDAKSRTEVGILISGQNVLIEVSYSAKNDNLKYKLKNVNIRLTFYNRNGQFLFELSSQHASRAFDTLPSEGKVYCHIPKFPLMAGTYHITATLSVNGKLVDQVVNAKSIETINGDFFKSGIVKSHGRYGVYIDHSWELDYDS